MDGRELARLRRAAGLSQVHLARLAELDPTAIQKLESGQQVNPKLSTLLALSKALGCRPVDFAPELLEIPGRSSEEGVAG